MLLGALEIPQNGVEVFLRGHDHPRASAADRTELLGDGLEVEHEVCVVADELTDLVD